MLEAKSLKEIMQDEKPISKADVELATRIVSGKPVIVDPTQTQAQTNALGSLAQDIKFLHQCHERYKQELKLQSVLWPYLDAHIEDPWGHAWEMLNNEKDFDKVEAEKQIESWKQMLEDNEPHNISVFTGKNANGRYHFIVDIDKKDELQTLSQICPELNDTLWVETPRGYHIHFLSYKPVKPYPQNFLIAPHTEILAGKRLVVMPPSVRKTKDGNYGKYSFVSNHSRIQYREDGNALISKLLKPVIKTAVQAEPSNRTTTLFSEDKPSYTELLAGVAEGSRDVSCIQLAGHYKAKSLPEEETREILHKWGDDCTPPFPNREVDKCVKSAYRYNDRPVLESVKVSESNREVEVKYMSLAEAMKETPDIEWAWENVISFGSIVALIAKPKVGKSHTLLNLALHLANGEDFLDRKIPQGIEVFYHCLDENINAIKARLGKRKPPDNFHITTDTPRVELLLKLMEDHPKSLIAVDTLQRLLGIKVKDFNDYAQVSNALSPIIEKVRQTGCIFIFTHHARKLEIEEDADGDNALGSTAIHGGVDTLLALKIKHEFRVLSSTQRLAEPIQDLTISLNEDGDMLTSGILAEIAIQKTIAPITEILQEAGKPLSVEDIKEQLQSTQSTDKTKISVATIRRTLKRMHQENLINQNGEGKKNSPLVFSL